MAGAPAPMPGEVAGKIIDFWRQPMPSVQVTIGSTTVMTDAQGSFRIPDVPATYDATFVINTTQNGDPMRFVWRYEGLTRRNPILQSYGGNPQHGAWLNISISGYDFMRPKEGDTLIVSYGGVLGEWTTNAPTKAQEQLRLVWEGPISTHFTGHAFRMLKVPGRIEPNDYYAHDSFTFDVTADRDVQVDYELPNTTFVPSGTITGTLDGAPGSDRSISMYMRFADNAVIPLMEDPAAGATFSYGIPSIPGATVTLVAGQDGNGYQLMHVDGIDSNTGNVALTMPAGVRQVAPPADATVDFNTTFLWEAEPNVYVFSAQDEVGRDLVHVVTTKREARLPQAPTFVYQAHRFSWVIEVHGTYASVDAATGPEGFLDTLASYNTPRGPARGKGTYVESNTLYMSIKP